ncbi:MAG: hypothetical protein ACLFT1_06180 [Desulfonatronovibrio sp.]
MSLTRVFIVLFLLTFYMSGCASRSSEPTVSSEQTASEPVASQVPVPAAYPLNTQPKMQAMHHWEVLAEDVVSRISGFLEVSVFETYYPVYVAAGGTTPFEKAFYDLLITKMVEKGIRVSRNRNEAMVLSFDLHMVRHSKRTIMTREGVFKSLVPGMFVQRQSPEMNTSASIRLNELHVAQSRINVDSGKFTHHVPNVEIMVTTSLTRNDNYIVRDSSIYYINDADWGNYKQNVLYQDPSVVNYKLVD